MRDAPTCPDMRWVQLGVGNASTDVTLTTWFERLSPGVLEGPVIDVEDPDGCPAKLVAAGVECSDVGDEAWGRYFMCRDPDGDSLVVAKVRGDASG